jgi:hypothetical protein
MRCWSDPTPENEKAATLHLTLEFTRLHRMVASRWPSEI